MPEFQAFLDESFFKVRFDRCTKREHDFLFAMVKCGLVPMPTEANWKHVYGTAIVCGIGFTMSIFVSILAFAPGHAQEMAKGGVLIGSIISAIIGYGYLRIVGAKRKECHIGVYHNC